MSSSCWATSTKPFCFSTDSIIPARTEKNSKEETILKGTWFDYVTEDVGLYFETKNNNFHTLLSQRHFHVLETYCVQLEGVQYSACQIFKPWWLVCPLEAPTLMESLIKQDTNCATLWCMLSWIKTKLLQLHSLLQLNKLSNAHDASDQFHDSNVIPTETWGEQWCNPFCLKERKTVLPSA